MHRLQLGNLSQHMMIIWWHLHTACWQNHSLQLLISAYNSRFEHRSQIYGCIRHREDDSLYLQHPLGPWHPTKSHKPPVQGQWTAMGNAQKPTPQTCHIDIIYFSLCKWVKCDLMLLDCINTSINMADHLTKALQPTLFHCHANFYSATFHLHNPLSIGQADFPNHSPLFVPASFTTPLTATAAHVRPQKEDFQHNPWLSIICMDSKIHYSPLSST
jgi:hypothetical protein